MTVDDRAAVEALLGRRPQGSYEVVVERHGGPIVIRNAPLLDDGTPMPTRYWLIGREEVAAVGRLEAGGGVRQAEATIDPVDIAAAHERYAAERDAAVPRLHQGPRPYGGVGGTRRGVKCLHAHVAWYLAGGDDPVGRWAAAAAGLDLKSYETTRPQRPLARRLAAIDCGTNSTRLLIADAAGTTVDRRMTITRLGEGVDASGQLSPAAIERTLAVLRQYRSAMDGARVGAVMATATSAARDASNGTDLLTPAGEILGTELRVLDGVEEGRLSYRGATSELDEGDYTVLDVGGGSTELVAISGGEVAAVSMNVGCVRITERYLKTDPPTLTELEAARAEVRRLLRQARPERFRGQVVGLAGTVSALGVLNLGLETYDRDAVHHSRLLRSDIERIFDQIARCPVAERREMRGMELARADVLVGGMVVLLTVMEELEAHDLIISESDILDGMIAELAT